MAAARVRFSDKIKKKGLDDVSPSKQSGYRYQPVAVKSEWLVYNGQSQSTSKGVNYRISPDLKDVALGRQLVKFGETVVGIPTDNDWLKVGRLYLPMKLNGAPILVPKMTAQAEGEEDPTEMWKKWKIPTPKDEPPKCVGTGKLYEVIHKKVVGRPAPSFAAPMHCVKEKGEIIELFDFDETGKWRRGLACPENHLVWFLLDHEEFGPLLRPHGQPLSAAPMEPVCVAASENLIDNLQRFLDMGSEANIYDVTGKTPLMLAAEKNNLTCCVLLVEAGADPTMRSKAPCDTPGKSAVEMSKSAETKELLKAICGYKEFDMQLLDQASLRLAPDHMMIVDGLVESAGRAVKKGVYLVEGQEGPPLDNPQPTPEPSTSPASFSGAEQPTLVTRTQAREPVQHSGGSREHGVLHEVVHDAVWIRQEASSDAAKIAIKKKGELVELFESDESGEWARVEHEAYEGHVITGWMLKQHYRFGMLLQPVSEGSAI